MLTGSLISKQICKTAVTQTGRRTSEGKNEENKCKRGNKRGKEKSVEKGDTKWSWLVAAEHREIYRTQSVSRSESTTSTRSEFQESVVTRSKEKAGKWF